MKSKFIGYYRLDNKELELLLSSATICIDANVLLNLYRYSSETRDALLSALSSLGERLWLPHQAALEFHKNRVPVIYTQLAAYGELREVLDSAKKALSEALSKFSKHSVIDVKQLKTRIEKNFQGLEGWVLRNEEKHPDLVANDSILDKVTELFEGRVGEPYDDNVLNSIIKDGEKRFGEERPPGYKDAKSKTGPAKYGDYIIWRQIIDKVRETKLPLIFVTDDVKEDWWQRVSGKTIGPRPELIEEFRAQTGQVFYMYKPEQFVKFSAKPGSKVVPEATLQEMKNVRNRLAHSSIKSGNGFSISRRASKDLLDVLNTVDAARRRNHSEIAALKVRLKSLPEDSAEYAEILELLTTLSSESLRLQLEIDAVFDELSRAGESPPSIDFRDVQSNEEWSRVSSLLKLINRDLKRD